VLHTRAGLRDEATVAAGLGLQQLQLRLLQLGLGLQRLSPLLHDELHRACNRMLSSHGVLCVYVVGVDRPGIVHCDGASSRGAACHTWPRAAVD